MTHETALDGTIVVELGARIGASVCGQLLAQLGATVFFVEGLPHGASPSKETCREQFAAGKRSLRIDPADRADAALLDQLLAAADAVIISSDVDRVTLPDGLSAIVCDVTAYGPTGPDSGRPDSDQEVQARSGILDTTGDRDSGPVPITLPILEHMAGAFAAGGVLAALRVAQATGQRQRVDVALYDCAFVSMTAFLPKLLLGIDTQVERIGNRHTMISPWNVYRARDGWVLICAGSDQQWVRICRIIGREELASDPRYARIADRVIRTAEVDAVMQAWVGSATVADCLKALAEAEIAGGPVAQIDAHPVEPNLSERGMIVPIPDRAAGTQVFVPGSPLRMSATPGRAPVDVPAPDEGRAAAAAAVRRQRPRTGSEEIKAPLAGVRVIEIGHYTTVPVATKHFGAMGADVIKIEPPEGEATREWPPVQNRQSYYFTYMNSDKRSVTLDLRTEEGAEALWRLIDTADVLIENLKPGALAKRGFSYEAMSRRNPRLIYAGVSGFGVASLYPGRPAFDTVIQAMSGMMDVIRSGETPMKTGISSADLLGAEMSVVAVLGALAFRERTGRGQSIDLSMQDIAAWVTQTAWNGHRAGRGPATVLVACSDGYVLAAADRIEDAPALTRAELVDRLAAQGIRAAPVLTTPEVVRSPQTTGRRLWFTATEDGLAWPLLECPITLSLTPVRVKRPIPALGRDNQAIIGEAPANRQAEPAAG